MEQKLNKFLSDLIVEYHKLQQFHWYVKGQDFFPVHAKLEEYYNGFLTMIDDVAEHILMLNGKPVSTLKEFLETSSIKELDGNFISSSEIYEHIVTDFTFLLEEVIEIKEFADKENNYMVSATMDSYIANFTKSLWMIKQQNL